MEACCLGSPHSLGTVFTGGGHTHSEVPSRIATLWGRYHQLKGLLSPRGAGLGARMHLTNLSLRRTAAWASGPWRLFVVEARRLNSAEWEIVRRVMGVARRPTGKVSYYRPGQ